MRVPLVSRDGLVVDKGGAGLDPKPTETTAGVAVGETMMEKTTEPPGKRFLTRWPWSHQLTIPWEASAYHVTTNVTAKNSTDPSPMNNFATASDKP